MATGSSNSRARGKSTETAEQEEAAPAAQGEQLVSTTATEAAPEQGQQETPGGEESGGGTSYLNTSGGWLVYDEQGHGVDKDTWTPDVKLDRIGRQYRDAGYLKSRTALGMT